MIKKTYPLSLFSATGVEIEYMIVDQKTLDILPIADALMEAVAGDATAEIERGDISWSNELALHVLELKTTSPASDLAVLPDSFAREVRHANQILEHFGAMLMPTAMHPWMDPMRQTRIWPHEYSKVYKRYDAIFDCRGHGWSNLQSTHINLPFANEDEFVRLHSAIRCLLPIMPALSASSPIADGQLQPGMATRMEHYRRNSRRVPQVAGAIVPEQINSYAEYEKKILNSMYKAIAPLDPGGVLQHEWLNSRGAITRFDRGAIEIRVLDSQESPTADLALVWLITKAVQALTEERVGNWKQCHKLPLEKLSSLFNEVITSAEETVISDTAYLKALGVTDQRSCSAGDLWQHILQSIPAAEEDVLAQMAKRLVELGPLARRLHNSVKSQGLENMPAIYRRLCNCLAEDRFFK